MADDYPRDSREVHVANNSFLNPVRPCTCDKPTALSVLLNALISHVILCLKMSKQLFPRVEVKKREKTIFNTLVEDVGVV